MEVQTVTSSKRAKRASSGQRVRGSDLLDALKQRARADGITMTRLQAIIGVSRSYWVALGYGQRFVPSLGRDVLQACADYLAIPYLNVLLLAEAITPADFIRGANANCRADLVRAMAFISSDPKLSGFVSNWQRLDDAALLLIVQLYEKATGTNLLARSMDMIDGLKGLNTNKH